MARVFSLVAAVTGLMTLIVGCSIYWLSSDRIAQAKQDSAIAVANAVALSQGQITQVQHRKRWPYVKHYYFHPIDPDRGHVTIRLCGYPPFGAQVILNGHEWVEREAAGMQATVTKSGNCFIEGGNFDAINRLASGLNCAPAIEH